MVDDVPDALARSAELGGTLLAGPIEVPNGTFAALADPPGAAFGILAGPLDD